MDDPGTLEKLLTLLRVLAVGVIVSGLACLSAIGVIVWQRYWENPADNLVVVAIDATDQKILWQGKPGTYKPDDISIEGSLQQWLKWCRWRSDDAVVNEMWKDDCINMTTGQARTTIEQYFKDRDIDRQGSNRMRVALGQFKRLRESSTLYRISWTETWSPLYGGAPQTVHMSATITVDLRTKRDKLKAGDVKYSDLGIYIIDVFWDEERQG